MALDINKVKARLQKLQSKGNNTEKIDYKKLFFKPQLGKQTIRIVPNKFSPDFPCSEVVFHNQNVFKKSIYSLENWGEKDPISQFRKELYNDSDAESKEFSEETAKKLAPRSKAFAQVIVRGREAEGVLLWEMNKTTYETLLNIIAQDDEYGDITDVMDGTDLVVEGYSAAVKIGNRNVDYVAVNITPKRKTSPLADDEKTIEKWLQEQKNPLEIYKKYSYEEIKDMLAKWLDPESSEKEADEEKEETKEETKTFKKTQPKLEKTITVEDDEDTDEDDDDDAPFEEEKPKTSKSKVLVKASTKKTEKRNFGDLFDDED